MIKQEMEDKLYKDNKLGEEIAYQDMIMNTFEENHIRNISQMEQWSILSNVIKYIQYNRNPRVGRL